MSQGRHVLTQNNDQFERRVMTLKVIVSNDAQNDRLIYEHHFERLLFNSGRSIQSVESAGDEAVHRLENLAAGVLLHEPSAGYVRAAVVPPFDHARIEQ